MARSRRRAVTPAATLALLLAGAPLAFAAFASAAGGDDASRAHPPEASTSFGTAKDLGVLYIGAHPDDESGTLSTLGAWKHQRGVQAGVVTVTRGEGGGNAVGTEEGPALGLLREGEERRAIGTVG